MDGQPTSGRSDGGVRVLAPATWRAFGAFLRRPSLPDRADGVSRAGLLDITRLFPLDLLVMALLIGGFGVLTALGLKMPAHALEGLKIGPGLALLIVLGAPIAEETIFRGWLSGRPGHVLAWLAVLAGGLIAGFAALDLPQPTRAHVILGVMAAAVLVAAVLLWRLRGRPAWPWFQRRFAWFYYLSAIAFAAVHLSNFAGSRSPLLLALVLPQFVLGLILGYLRTRRGLWASMIFHALHNSVFIGLVALGAAQKA